MMETDEKRVQDIVFNYFSNIFKNDNKCDQVKLSYTCFPTFNDQMSSSFCREVTKEEV